MPFTTSLMPFFAEKGRYCWENIGYYDAKVRKNLEVRIMKNEEFMHEYTNSSFIE